MNEKSATLYPYPAVQYIPLLATAITEGLWDPPPGLNRPDLTVGRNDPSWREYWRRTYDLTLPPLTLGSGEILVLALNMKLIDLKYRGNFVTVLADRTPKRFELIRLDQRVFYKDRIIFEVYAQDGTRLCWHPWDRAARGTAARSPGVPENGRKSGYWKAAAGP